ncbi:uncharacterized protein [Dipodomys merriami]|uniref:uncharacterized protein isoform X1 n=1 Tax=Dipodomys merriami TaxID=94247 RepID=UPI0038515A86
MCPEERGATGLGELRSWWEVPAIAHFCSLFCTACCLPDFEIEWVSRKKNTPTTASESGLRLSVEAAGPSTPYPLLGLQGTLARTLRQESLWGETARVPGSPVNPFCGWKRRGRLISA